MTEERKLDLEKGSEVVKQLGAAYTVVIISMHVGRYQWEYDCHARMQWRIVGNRACGQRYCTWSINLRKRIVLLQVLSGMFICILD